MPSRREELDVFKTDINLPAFAAEQYGFSIDRSSSSRNSAVMVHGDGSKIIVAVAPDSRFWMYFNVHDDRDNGTIVDLVQWRERVSLGEVRKILRPWQRSGRRFAVPSAVLRLEPIARDLARVRAAYEATRPAPDHPYLIEQRMIPPQVLSHPKLAGRIRMDARQNAVFPHWSSHGLCGFELKNQGFTSFSPGGSKGLFCSRPRDHETRLVICESAIDCLSYMALHGIEDVRVLSIAGELNREQPELIQAAIKRMPPGSQIVAAVDRDPGGSKLLAELQALHEALRSTETVFVPHPPPAPAIDWNDVLRAPVAETMPRAGCG